MDNDTNLKIRQLIEAGQMAVDMIGKQTDFDIDWYTRLLTIHEIDELRQSVDLVTDRTGRVSRICCSTAHIGYKRESVMFRVFLTICFLLAIYAQQAIAGPNANATVTIDLIADGSTGNQIDDGVVTGTVSGQGTKFAVEVFVQGVTTTLIGVEVQFDFDASVLQVDKVENSAFQFIILEATGGALANVLPVTVPESGFVARAEFSTVSDVTNKEFRVGIKSVRLSQSLSIKDIVTTTSAIAFNGATSPPPDTGSTPQAITTNTDSVIAFLKRTQGVDRNVNLITRLCDLDGNGEIGISDFLIFVDHFGKILTD